MGADNWGVCPRCKRREDATQERVKKQVGEAYGKVSADEYLKLVERSQLPSLKVGNTLREDYEIGTDEDGEFMVVYSCQCSKCAYGFKFEHKEDKGL